MPGLGAELAATSLGTEVGVLPLTVDPAALEAVRASYPYRRDVNPLLRPQATEGRALDWSNTIESGTKIAEIRRAASREEADPQTRSQTSEQRSEERRHTLALVAVFVLLTFFDVFFQHFADVHLRHTRWFATR